MRHLYLLLSVFTLLFFVSRTSFAQAAPAGPRTGFGIGAEATTTGIVGATFVYDAAVFHLDALLGTELTNDDTDLATAVRFFFPLHHGAGADFSIGPGVGFVHHRHHPDPQPMGGGGGGGSNNQVHLEGAMQIRAFVVPNVALSASAGLGVVVDSGNNRAVIGGQVGASLGVTYFFW